MAATEIWSELGITRTDDPAVIRRAYAVRLKAIRPDADPQGFARLRAAYERALSAADASSRPTTASPDRQPVSPPPEAYAMMHEPSVPPMVQAVMDCMRRSDLLAAAESLAAARAAGALSLQDDIRLADQLGWALAQDRSVAATAVRAAAERLGWQTGQADGPWAKTLTARLDAERWLETLHRDAASRTRWLGAAVPIVARIFLGRGGLGLSRLMASDLRLKQRYGEYLLHAPAIEDQFDPARIDAIGRLLTRQAGPVVTAILGMMAVLAIAWATGTAAAEWDPRLQDGITGTTVLIMLVIISKRRGRAWLRRTIARLNRW